MTNSVFVEYSGGGLGLSAKNPLKSPQMPLRRLWDAAHTRHTPRGAVNPSSSARLRTFTPADPIGWTGASGRLEEKTPKPDGPPGKVAFPFRGQRTYQPAGDALAPVMRLMRRCCA